MINKGRVLSAIKGENMVNNYVVSAVISVYNEETTVMDVVKTVLECEFVDEVITVNDGSTDTTKNQLEIFQTDSKFKYLNFEKNKGKSYAMITGVEESKGDIIIFIDADLIGLNVNHINQILTELVSGKADMIIGQPTENKLDEKLNPFQMLSGERAIFKKDILPVIEDLRTVKYGIETLLNLYYKSKGLSIRFTYLWNLFHQIKPRKEGFNSFVKNYSMEAKDIITTLIAHHLLVWSALGHSIRKRKR
jgi:glycosyltransferase involved in cell wall biosynthesis